MAVTNIFKCSGNETETIPNKILEELNISFEDVNKDAAKIAILSKILRENKSRTYCTIPFCHTVEAEAFGSTVIFDKRVGNRINKYRIDNISSMEVIPSIDLTNGRIAEVLKAIKKLKEMEEKVCLNITGPISLATSIMDSRLFYKTLRKDRETANRLLNLIEDSIVAYMLEGIKQGADIISFADPTGTIDILGPRIYEEVSGKSTYNILKKIESQLGDTIVHLCGKTSTSLEAIGLLEIDRIKVEGKNYIEKIDNIRKERNDIKFIGHWCLKLDKDVNEITCCRIK
ncbi:hypothetical protein KQI42_00945 [Tissierella sp. MSJ-40]|uniref:Uroporphyrinogen decarboxylase (URO-D) domain-containing protein n=1 Tax=Tissierella simiarum TaxID=2841534 RepID=A0ABS6E1U9_9FIRM|nr:uroporphyrinogen decarboxylase family protein [Tissierella simiarum]MBU5436551.1 hypothetical protein [Tissierella simiarum]